MTTTAPSAPAAPGGPLVNLLVDASRAAQLKELALDLPDIVLNGRQLCDLELLTTGAFTPLTGFMNRGDYQEVMTRMRLGDGTLWPIPICLDVGESVAENLTVGGSAALRDPEGFLLAVVHIDEMWPADRRQEAQSVYGTLDPTHPGVRYLLTKSGSVYVGGRLEVLSLPIHYDFKSERLSPAEVQRQFQKLGWKRVVCFQTRHPIHRPQFEMTLRAMQRCKANLLLLPFEGLTNTGDFDHFTRVRCYREVLRHYPPDSVLLSLLPLDLRMAGPRNAMLHAILARNYGCSHIFIGPDHASPQNDCGTCEFYHSRAAIELVEQHGNELGVTPVHHPGLVYLPFEDEFRSRDQVPEDVQSLSLSHSDIRQRIRTGRRIPEWISFPGVEAELRRAYPAPRHQGFTVFLTGLSGAGKSTIAKILYSRFLEIGGRPVTLLDGDIVRRNLSSELTFSRKHRDINVRRIGFVASEITKNRGIAICAPIAPYEETREEIRRAIETWGGFFEIHVATPIEECERRDRKGMYAKARAGLIKGFTGVDDPYELPQQPELRIDTTGLTPNEAAQEILLLLGRRGYIG